MKRRCDAEVVAGLDVADVKCHSYLPVAIRRRSRCGKSRITHAKRKEIVRRVDVAFAPVRIGVVVNRAVVVACVIYVEPI